MRKADQIYISLLREILEDGEQLENKRRSGHWRLQIPTKTLEFDMRDGFPLLECKKVPFKSVVTELLWFLRGDTNTKFLVENGCRIWDKDAYNYQVNKGETFSFEEMCELDGGVEVGKSYGHQWRNYGGKVDQIIEMYNGFLNDRFSSRLVVSAWNPCDLGDVALPACHNFFQIIGGKNGFVLSFNMRSVDVFLGLPFNIASYALLGKIIEWASGVKFLKLVVTLNCVHLYDNQIDEAKGLVCSEFDRNGVDLIDVELLNWLCNENQIFWDWLDLIDVEFLKPLNRPASYEVFKAMLRVLDPKKFKILNYLPEKAVQVSMLAPDRDKVF